MALIGEVKAVGNSNAVKAVCLMATSTTANVAAPTSSPTAQAIPSIADGIPNYPRDIMFGRGDDGACFKSKNAMQSTLVVKGRATAAAVLVGTFTLWGYLVAADAWFEIPVNGGTALTPTALAETSIDQINHQQQFANLGHYDRLALSLEAIGGAGASFEAWLITGTAGTD